MSHTETWSIDRANAILRNIFDKKVCRKSAPKASPIPHFAK